MRRRRTRGAWIMLVMLGVMIAYLSGCVRLDAVRAVLVATPTEGVMPLTVEFILEETTAGGEGGSFLLEFGDGTRSLFRRGTGPGRRCGSQDPDLRALRHILRRDDRCHAAATERRRHRRLRLSAG